MRRRRADGIANRNRGAFADTDGKQRTDATAIPPATATATATVPPTRTPTPTPTVTRTPTPVTYCLGDFVWHDANRDGMQEAGEWARPA